MTVHASGVTVVVEKHGWRRTGASGKTFVCIMRVGAGRERMPNLAEFGVDVESGGRHIRTTAMAGETVLFVRPPEQTRRPTRFMGRMAGETGILCDRAVASNACHFVRRCGMDAGRPLRQRVQCFPGMVRVGSWQARHIWPLELSRNRKFSETWSFA